MYSILNIAICDDEKIEVELLNTYVKNWAKRNRIKLEIEFFYSGESFEFQWQADKSYDILLLDIEMPGINGVELAKRIRKKDDQLDIIFITAIPDYIGEGYDVSAINYLIKPIREEKLYECLDRSIEDIGRDKKTILIDADGDIIRINQEDIVYIESISHEIEINTIKDKYITRKNIGVIEKELDKGAFVRCHRSYIVGLKHIKKITKKNVEIDSGHLVPVSRRQYKKTNKAFIDYFRGGLDE